MKTYGQFCPIALALETLAERWSLLIVREMLCGSARFGELRRGVPKISRTLLSQRLTTLVECEIVERRELPSGPEYHLTEAGLALRPVVESIGVWGKHHVQRKLREDELDAGLLMWDLQRRLVSENLPRTRTVVLFQFPDAKKGERRFWLHLDDEIVDLCLVPPGFDVDLRVDSDVRTFTEVWRGDRSLKQALRGKQVRLDGPPALKRAFPTWLGLSAFADA